jgi:hypothetical protein
MKQMTKLREKGDPHGGRGNSCRTLNDSGTITIKAMCAGLESAAVQIQSKPMETP